MNLDDFASPFSEEFGGNVQLMGKRSDGVIKLIVRWDRENWEGREDILPPTNRQRHTRIAYMNEDTYPGRRVQLDMHLMNSGKTLPPSDEDEYIPKTDLSDISGIEVQTDYRELYIAIYPAGLGPLKSCGKSQVMAQFSQIIGKYLGFRVSLGIVLYERPPVSKNDILRMQEILRKERDFDKLTEAEKKQ